MLDMIRASTAAFAVKADDGNELRGVLTSGNMDSLAELFKQRVLILGRAVFKPSGKLLRIEAEQIAPGGVNLV